MSKRSRDLSDEERVLWRTVIRSIAPLRGRKALINDEAAPGKSDATAKPTQAAHGPLPSSPPSSRRVATPVPLQPIDRRMKQKLARGTIEIDGRIDLHGLTQAEAHSALARFLRSAQAREAKVVLVITGKGGAAGEGRGVLKRQVPMWLEGGEFRSVVIGFESAGLGHGGEGALYVRVRRGK